MIRRKSLVIGILTATALLILITDAKSTSQYVLDGIKLCIYSVIPALYPFLILVPVICSEFAGKHLAFMDPVRKMCKLPNGAEVIVFLGFLGGYPMGAALISSAFRNNQISKVDAKRMLGFCSNAGPAFIFGMLGPLFDNQFTLWVLWIIHILSAIIVGYFTRQTPAGICHFYKKDKVSIVKFVENSVRTLAIICSWVILFRIISGFLSKWLLYSLPNELQTIMVGILELSNGCVLLQTIPSEATRLLIASALLAFGGLCVMLQTKSVCADLSTESYFPGKLLQTCISIHLTYLLVPFLYDVELIHYLFNFCFTAFITVICIIFIKTKKVVAKRSLLMYNTEK